MRDAGRGDEVLLGMGAVMAARRERFEAATAPGVADATMDEIGQRMSDGESLKTICTAMDIPYSRMRTWIAESDAREETYQNFKAAFVEHGVDLATRAVKDATPETVAVARLHSDHFLKLAKAYVPKEYGDKTDVNVNVQQWVLRLPEQAESTEQWRASVARVINSAQTPALTSGSQVPETVSADAAPV